MGEPNFFSSGLGLAAPNPLSRACCVMDRNKILPDWESNPGLPRDRRRYSPLYYQGMDDRCPFLRLGINPWILLLHAEPNPVKLNKKFGLKTPSSRIRTYAPRGKLISSQSP